MKRVLLSLILIITAVFATENPKAVIVFDASGSMWGEFKPLNSYTMSDFHFAKPIIYMDIASFTTKPFSDGKHFELRKDYRFHIMLKIGKLTMSEKRRKYSFDYLAHAILNKKYFWKRATPLLWDYTFTTLRFIEQGDPRLKAITESQDIIDLFGEIDTPAELHVWIEAMYRNLEFLHSWKKVNNLYRIHFKGFDNASCIYDEHFDYFDKHGKKVKTETIQNYRKKGCVEAVP